LAHCSNRAGMLRPRAPLASVTRFSSDNVMAFAACVVLILPLPGLGQLRRKNRIINPCRNINLQGVVARCK
jgi:hypothetical protein